jgi:hypothetical protein
MIDNWIRVVEFILIYNRSGLRLEISQKQRNRNRNAAEKVRLWYPTKTEKQNEY